MYTAKEFRARAIAMVGLPYVLGAEWSSKIVPPDKPKAVDCSELVEGLFRENETPIGDLAASQYSKTVAVTGAIHVGDLVFLKNNPARWNGIGHVAVITAKLSNGDWEIVEARGHLYGVVRTTLSYWKTRKYFTGVRRFPKFALKATPVTIDKDKLRATVLYARQAKKDYGPAVMAITAVDTFEGGLWAKFMKDWDDLNTKLVLNQTVPTVPTANHAFVVLGAGLPASGELPKKFKRRLDVALAALKAYPNSKVLVTGGKAQSGWTEGARGHQYLLANGISDERIIVESKASSTVGNAIFSVPLLISNGITSYTIVSDFSHIRRASVLFDAAVMKLSYKNGKAPNLTRVSNVGYKDKVIVNPPTTATNDAIVQNVAILLGIYAKYNEVVNANKVVYPTLKKGSKGDWVKALQAKIGVTVDGDFGPKTEAAVKKAQKKLGLEVDGVAGPITLKALRVKV